MAYEILDDAPKGRYEVIDEPAAVSAGKTINSIPRQLGLTARYGVEGVANALQVGTEPIRYATDRLLGLTGKTKPLGALATQFADAIGLPAPETANERVVGDAAKLVAGAGGLAGGAAAAARLPGMLGNVMTGLAANPLAQLSSAAGAGLAGGASREAGGNELMQGGAALLGGVAGGMVPGGLGLLADNARRTVTPSMSPQQIDAKLTTVLQDANADYTKLPESVQRALRTELKSSLQAGKELDPQAVRRLADFRTVGATPTRGMVSQDPVQITREMNLAKMAANSGNGELHGLPRMQNENNRTLISGLNAAGGRTETDPIAAGRAIQSRIMAQDAGLSTAETQAWEAAKGMPGYSTGQMSTEPVHAAFKKASDTGLLDYLAPPVANRMEAYMTGKVPFTPNEYANLRSMVSGSLSPTANSNEKKVAKAVADALDSADIRMRTTNPGGIDFGNLPSTSATAANMRAADAAPQQVINAIDEARRATAAKYRYQESSPLVKTALADARNADPEKIAKSFVIDGTVNDALSVVKEVGPGGVGTIRDALATYIKRQSMGGSADEVGKVSQSALNSTLRKIGDEKLGLFFSPEEVTRLKAMGRVASYMQTQPVGSAVNNSNSGALLLGRGMDFLNKTPVLGPLVGPAAQNINLSLSTRQAQNTLPGLLAPTQRQPLTPSLLLPALAAGGGLLSSP